MTYWYQFDSSNLAQIVDTVSPTLKYVGYTQSNIANVAEPVRYIKKIETIGSLDYISRSNWSANFKAIWDDRATISYS